VYSLNKFMGIGNLGRDPEMKVSPSGMPMLRFSIALEKSWKKADGTWDRKTSWLNCVIFGKLADIMEKRIHKGSKVYIEGALEIVEKQDAEGKRKSYTNLNVSDVLLLDRSEGGCARDNENPSSPKHSEVEDDDIPF
jgi:single-strand DNA-binding protein